MLNIPEDLVASPSQTSICLPQAIITSYQTDDGMASAQALVSRPTLVLVRSGVKQLSDRQSNSTHTARSGELIVFRSGTHLMSEFLSGDETYRSIVVSLDRDFLRQAIGDPQEQRTSQSRIVATRLSHEARKKIQDLPANLQRLESETEKEFRLRECIVTTMADDSVRKLLYDELADWGNSIEERISKTVSAHYLSPIRIHDFATLCSMSLASFKRHFTSLYKASPGKWLQEKRLNHAYKLAQSSRLTIAEICEASGYQDLSSFTRAFRRHHGKTPSVIRQNASQANLIR